MALQLAIQAGIAALHTQQQQAEEVEQRQRRVDAQIRGRGRDLLCLQARLIVQARCEKEPELVRCAQVASEEVGEGAARGVERRRVGVVSRVPCVFEVGEGFGGVFCAEDEVAFCVVGLEVCIDMSVRVLILMTRVGVCTVCECAASNMVDLRVASRILA